MGRFFLGGLKKNKRVSGTAGTENALIFFLTPPGKMPEQ